MSKRSSHNEPKHPLASGPETRDANFKNLMITGIGLLGILVLGLLISWAVYSFFDKRTPVETFTVPDTSALPPGPRLEPDPRALLVSMRREEDSVLTSYAWINKDSGLVRVPITRAMELLVKKGLPARSTAPSAK